MNKITTGILLSVLGIGVVGSGTTLIWNSVLTNHETMDYKESKVTYQNKLIKDKNYASLEGYTLDNPKIILNPFDISPLSALITFKTDTETKVTITIQGKDEYSTFTYEFGLDTNHYLPIYGLYPGTTNKVTITAGDKSVTKDIVTNPLPKDFILPVSKPTFNKDKLTSEELKNDFKNKLYMFTPAARGYTCAYDVNGDVRWYLTDPSPWSPARLKNGHLLIGTERLVNPPYYVTGLYESDMLGRVYHEYTLEGGYHHDFDELPNGNLLIASNNFNNGMGTVEDVVVELDRKTGKEVKRWDLLNDKTLDKHKGSHPELSTAYDWFHNNSVWYDEPTNSITLSGRHKDAVINIDYDTGKLNWIIGDSKNWGEENQKYFLNPIKEEGKEFEWQWCQHAAMILPHTDKNIFDVFVLDNGNDKSKNKDEWVPAKDSYTRGVIYEVNLTDPNNRTIRQKWEYGKERGSDYYSPYISDVDYFEDGHYIVHSGGIVKKDGEAFNYPAGFGTNIDLKSITTELLNDEILFEINLPTNNYRVEKIDVYNSSDVDYKFSDATRLGTLGSTPITNKKFGLITYKNIDDEYKSHNIKILEEEDRIAITGTYKKDTDLQIILYGNLHSNVYDVRVAKRPYTALCIDIFTPEETKNGLRVTKYINKEGLKGDYSVYIKINGTTYNTGKSVKF